MFCPNCGANNNKKQNYCRFCGLSLQDTAKSLMNQIIFGQDSKVLKTLSSVKRTVDFTSAMLIVGGIVGVVAYYFFGREFGKDLAKTSLVIYFLLKLVQEVISYFQRRERSKAKPNNFGQGVGQFEPEKAVKFLDEKPFEPARSVAEHTTELLPIENKTRKLE